MVLIMLAFGYSGLVYKGSRQNFLPGIATAFLTQWQVAFGSFETIDYDTIDPIHYGMFCAATMVVCLVMMNIVIAIMSDTYA